MQLGIFQRGLEILSAIKEKYNLKEKKIQVFLSPEFSLNKPHDFLIELQKIYQEFIVYDIRPHPKVYYLKGLKEKLPPSSTDTSYWKLWKEQWHGLDILEIKNEWYK